MTTLYQSEGISMDITGLKEVRDMLTNVSPKESTRILKRTTLGLMRTLGKDAKSRVQVHTGNMRKAIKWKRKRGRPGVIEAALVIAKSGYYWHLLEFGTVKMRAFPFIIPAVEAARRKIGPYFKEHFFREYQKKMAKRLKGPK